MSAAHNNAPSAEQLTKTLGGSWSDPQGSANCPAHDDQVKSLSIGTGRKGQIVLDCKAGCDYQDVREAIRDVHGIDLGSAAMCLDLYAHAKKLPVDFLLKLGLRDGNYRGTPCVMIPYYGVDGQEKAIRYRMGMQGSRFLWKKGTKTMLYGLDRLGSNTVAFLVEGESDAQTLWHHNFPAIGLPGASNWDDDRDASHFDGIKEIYAIVEPGKSGQTFCDQLRNSRIKDRVLLLTLPVKDASELHITTPDPKRFEKLLIEAIDKAEWFADWETRQPKLGDIIDEFNRQYSVVNEGGKCVVYAPRQDETFGRVRYDRITFDDLNKMYLNRDVWVGKKLAKASRIWLEDPNRKQYLGGIVFRPQGSTPDGVLNLWQGLFVRPKAGGSWTKLKEHIRTVICTTAAEFDFLLCWMARLVQYPGERGEVAVVLRGAEGTGKGTLASVLMRIIGQHAMRVSQAKHLTGNFNSHLRDCVFLFADEAFFAGDRQHEGVLKALITEEWLTIEGKYQNVVLSPNYLHLMIASNKEWVVPAGLKARRFAVFEVSEEHRNDQNYFGAIWQELNNGGLEAMLDELLGLDINKFNHRLAPDTEGLQNQKIQSLPSHLVWWMEVLMRGYVHVSKYGMERDFQQWMPEVSTEPCLSG